MTKQTNRKIVHLLYAVPTRRGKDIEIIEDIIPVCDTELKVKCEKKPSGVSLAPQKADIDFDYRNGYVSFKIEKFECHQMIAIDTD